MSRLILTISLLLLSLLFLFIFSLPDRNVHVVFCDVGQGDAILITYGTNQILVDGGQPNGKVLSCLSRHMPFWDRRIEVVSATHPQLDHFGGFIDVIKRYRVDILTRPEVEGEIPEWKILKDEIKKRSIPEKFLSKGGKISIGSLRYDIESPFEGHSIQDLNEYSIVGNLSYGDFDVSLTGDVMLPTINEIEGIREAEVLKVPHHGSKNGLTREFLEIVSPKLAIMSLGKNNQYGHPHKETLDLLDEFGVRVLRTDIDGEVEVVSDGKRWWVKD